MSQIVEITAETASRKETTFHGFSLTLTITTQNSSCTTQSVVFVSVLLEFRRIMNFWRSVDVQMSRVVSCCAGNIGADDGKQLLPPEAAARSSGGDVLDVPGEMDVMLTFTSSCVGLVFLLLVFPVLMAAPQHFHRSLPHFTKDDYGAESRGFVENSYLAGLTPQEVYMHAMGGREGVIDTACKTSETGYIQRRLVKSMETLSVRYDGTVRNGCDDVIQFLYGEDGMDGLYIEDQALDIMTFSNADFEKKFKHDYTSETYGVKWLPPQILSEIKSNPEWQAVLDQEYETLKGLKEMCCTEIFPDGDSKQHIPINITRLLGRAKLRAKQEDVGNMLEKYTPVEIVNKMEQLMNTLEVTRAIAEGDTIGREVEDNAKIVLNAHIRSHLGAACE